MSVAAGAKKNEQVSAPDVTTASASNAWALCPAALASERLGLGLHGRGDNLAFGLRALRVLAPNPDRESHCCGVGASHRFLSL